MSLENSVMTLEEAQGCHCDVSIVDGKFNIVFLINKTPIDQVVLETLETDPIEEFLTKEFE